MCSWAAGEQIRPWDEMLLSLVLKDEQERPGDRVQEAERKQVTRRVKNELCTLHSRAGILSNTLMMLGSYQACKSSGLFLINIHGGPTSRGSDSLHQRLCQGTCVFDKDHSCLDAGTSVDYKKCP